MEQAKPNHDGSGQENAPVVRRGVIINYVLSTTAADRLALAVFDLIESKKIATRSMVSDALEEYAAIRFDVTDGSEIEKLRAFAQLQRSQ